MSFGQNKLLFGDVVLIILAVVPWRDKSRVAERCLGAWTGSQLVVRLSIFLPVFIQGE
jgi:hypothetical protein